MTRILLCSCFRLLHQ